MLNIAVAIPLIICFLIVFLFMPLWIRKSKNMRLVWEDMNKFSKPKVPGSGGAVLLLGFILSCLIYLSFRIFIEGNGDYLVEILALLIVILMLSEIGLIDDLIGWKKGGISKKTRLILVSAVAIAFAAIPLILVNAGTTTISLPFVGFVNLGLVYTLIIIPLGVVGATTTFNFLAGFNGLEAGQGAIILSAMALVAYFTGNAWLAIISLIMVFGLVAFLFYNFSPAKVLPGDSLTYAVGGLIAIICIMGNFEKIAVFFFIPYILETILKSRGKLSKHSFGLPMKDGSLELKYDKIYGLTHLGILILQKLGVKPSERKVVLLIWAFQLIIILLGLLIFRGNIF